jgi:hypothetical protein
VSYGVVVKMFLSEVLPLVSLFMKCIVQSEGV